MRHQVAAGMVSLALLLGAATGCGEHKQPPANPQQPSANPQQPPANLSADDYEPSIFDDSANIDNQWYPIKPGTRLLYTGSSLEDGERVSHTVVVIVTDLTKIIDGVRNVVVWERDILDNELAESELALFAEDKYGNVWHMGEFPVEYDDGEFDKAPAWVHGLRGATAGITIPGSPRTGTPDYAQGFAPPPIDWVDRGRVYKTGQKTCVVAGCYEDVVVIEEFETGVPEAFQDKFYAPGVGVVRVGWRGSKDDSKEVLKLIEVSQLSTAQLDAARAQALQLEDLAYDVSKKVWALTPRAELAD